MMPSTSSGSLIRATPPSRRMSAGTRSSAMTATAPASSAILACSACDHVHDDAALEHLGQAALDAHGAGVVGREQGKSAESLMRPVYGRRHRRSPATYRSNCVRGRRSRGDGFPPPRRPQSSRRRAMRSSSGGWVSNRRLRRGQPALALGLRRRLLDPQVGGGAAGGVDHRGVVAQLLQGRDQPGRVAGHLDAGHVGQRLPAAADGPLHHLARSAATATAARSRRPTGSPAGPVAAVLAVVEVAVRVAAHAPPQQADADVGEQRHDAHHGDGQGRHEDVVVLDVATARGRARPRARCGSASRAGRW